MPLSVDFGAQFSSIESLTVTGALLGDLWDQGEIWQISLFGGQLNVSGPSQSSFEATAAGFGPPLSTELLDGIWSFDFMMQSGSVSLSTLTMSVTGTLLPEPSTSLLVVAGVLGLAGWRMGRS